MVVCTSLVVVCGTPLVDYCIPVVVDLAGTYGTSSSASEVYFDSGFFGHYYLLLLCVVHTYGWMMVGAGRSARRDQGHSTHTERQPDTT